MEQTCRVGSFVPLASRQARYWIIWSARASSVGGTSRLARKGFAERALRPWRRDGPVNPLWCPQTSPPCPISRFRRDELSEVGRRTWKCGGAPLGKPRLHPGIGHGRIDSPPELRLSPFRDPLAVSAQ